MYPLPIHTVDLLLQYISPLTDPFPPHLISAPLRQRHHFLQISPASPAEYLCWPSSDGAKAIDLLDRLPPPSDKASYPTRYTSDPESTFAHVQVSSDAPGLRMLFHWDDGWKYHDLRLMPFPPSSFATPQEALAGSSACPAGPPLSPARNLFAEADHSDGNSDDTYWDAYGVVEHDPTSPLAPPSTSIPGAVGGEDAYWAQYASVQGSADSTIPSPLPINRKLRHANSNEYRVPPQNHPVIDIPADAIHSRPSLSMLGPPSPNMLADLLSTISPREDIRPDDLYSLQLPSAYSSDPSPEQTATDSEVITPPLPNGFLDATVVSPVEVKVDTAPLPDCQIRPLDEAEDKALTDSIKGLYHLWKAGRKGEPDETDRSVFLRLVQTAIPYE